MSSKSVYLEAEHKRTIWGDGIPFSFTDNTSSMRRGRLIRPLYVTENEAQFLSSLFEENVEEFLKQIVRECQVIFNRAGLSPPVCKRFLLAYDQALFYPNRPLNSLWLMCGIDAVHDYKQGVLFPSDCYA
jgi:hypothetical protein